jgi:hypothetical protein
MFPITKNARTGKRHIPPAECPACGETGYDLATINELCEECGEAVIASTATANWKPCPHCDAEGATYSGSCGLCAGAGWIAKGHARDLARYEGRDLIGTIPGPGLTLPIYRDGRPVARPSWSAITLRPSRASRRSIPISTRIT